ncbi:DNA-binding helix-turn-helix protein [Leptospira broomii serovar Hurstbridge str. 5399]|uniref:DNA-binding helix-turn-helix protein n=1 Tax=Leptospira broomii serovar Hurstbridge str. 5399 TaxID=1049789 RepID=T0GG87_9LEPT|nr:helix-turn-helix domain-containing protein [Leptospira broomii]EQA45864.1 DNA-binding helix-turn-helix protein [Leptospira broomii serovar Hurstbridge str. 5399]
MINLLPLKIPFRKYSVLMILLKFLPLFVWIQAFLPFPLNAESPVRIDEGIRNLNVSTYVEYRHRDRKFTSCTIDNLKGLQAFEWYLNPIEDVLRVRRTSNGVWLRLTVRNDSNVPLDRRILFNSINVPKAELCYISEKGEFRRLELTDHSDELYNKIVSPRPNFRIRFPAKTEYALYIHLDAYEELTYVNFPLSLLDEEAFDEMVVWKRVIFSAILAIYLFVVGLNIYYSRKLQARVFLSLATYMTVLFFGFYFLHGRSIHSWIGWENKISFYSYYLFLTVFFLSLFGYLFHLARFFELKDKSVLFFAIGCLFSYSFVLIPLVKNFAEERFFLLAGGFGILAYYFYRVHSSLIVKNSFPIRLYLLSWLLFISCFFIKASYHFDYAPYNWLIVFSFLILFPLHAVVTTYALSRIISEGLWISLPAKSFIRKSKIGSIDIGQTVLKLKELLEVDKIFLKHSLKEEHLARELGIGAHQLSEVVRMQFHTTFPNLINSYRIEEAKRLLIEDPSMSTNEVRIKAGYSSKSAFHLEFKKATNTNPNAFRRKAILGDDGSRKNGREISV